MYTNKIGCTVYKRTAGANRMETYIRHFIPAIYWEDSAGQAQSGTMMQQQNTVFCMIPATSLSDYLPKRDDLLVCGRCELAEPPETAKKIMSVDDFRYGSADVQHIEVTAG